MKEDEQPKQSLGSRSSPLGLNEQKQEKQDEQKVEQIQQGVQFGAGSIVKQGSVVMNAGMEKLGLQ